MCFYFCLSLFKHILQAKVALKEAKRNKTHPEGSPLVFKNVVYVIILIFSFSSFRENLVERPLEVSGSIV